MENGQLEVVGAAIAAIGTITAAVGSTPFWWLSEQAKYNLNLWGNLLQGTGNALEANGQGEISLEKIGNEIQAVGNSTIVAGLLLLEEEEVQTRLTISGNLMQALGGAAALGDELKDDSNIGEVYSIVGNIMQIIGNSMQALGDGYDLRAEELEEATGTDNGSDEDNNNKGEVLNVFGSWIQAGGSVLSFIGQVIEEEEE
ncbi:hypothetical protein AS180_14390 [Priestia veravalensis]|uniref:Uncharacterized protein n=1 Tax=Priestia veravalensis TaxID=1414648 RepID=A0A0V8JJK4_9BACI|nr:MULTISPECIES: hypothetical protein [Priestia]KSU87221.1 hypothetical protein AS180_14390 [Priestia veravalensis]